MPNEANFREFDFKSCPFCHFEYKDSHCVRIVKEDDTGVRQLLMRCDGCGILYQVDSRVLWFARAIESGKPLSQNIADFLEGREKHIIKHFKDRRS